MILILTYFSSKLLQHDSVRPLGDSDWYTATGQDSLRRVENRLPPDDSLTRGALAVFRDALATRFTTRVHARPQQVAVLCSTVT